MTSDIEIAVKNNIPVLIDFQADWCGACTTLAPIVEDIQKEFENKLIVLQVDADKNRTLTLQFGVQSLPTLILFKSGQLLWRKTGLLTKRELREVISKNIKNETR